MISIINYGKIPNEYNDIKKYFYKIKDFFKKYFKKIYFI
jgi:hypothetical protein